MADVYDITIVPADVSQAEIDRWKTRLLNAKNDMIAGIEATDYSQALQKAVSEYYNKVVAGTQSASVLRGYAKLVARLPAVDPNELKNKLVAAIQSEDFDQAVEASAAKWGELIAYVKGAGLGGRQVGEIIAGYVDPNVAPFVVPGAVAATVMVGFYGLIFARAVQNGYPEDQAEAMLAEMADNTLKHVIEKALAGDATLTAFSVNMTPGDNPTVTIHLEIERAGNTGGSQG